MTIPFFLVDAFTTTPFAGNPAGVCLLDAPLPSSWMQDVAHEVGASETAFVIQPRSETPRLRWFTPTDEVDLCGHATLAAAHALRKHLGAAWVQEREASVAFDTASGRLVAQYATNGGITLDFPADPPRPQSAPEGLVRACRVPAPVYVGRSDRDWLLHLPDATAVSSATPDLEAVSSFDTRGVILTAQAPAQASHDFVSRFFAPRVGVPEDPVTGSAHCALGPYWGQQLQKTDLVGRQVSARGGTVRIHLPPPDQGEDQPPRVLLNGSCATVVDGTWVAPPTNPDAAQYQSSSQ